MPHANVGLELLRQIDENGGGTGMQAGPVAYNGIEEGGIIYVLVSLYRRGGGRALARQSFDDIAGIAGARQALNLFFIAQHTGQAAQDLDMFIGLRGNTYNEME